MIHDKSTDYITRDSVLRLLSDAEVASVSTAETAADLADGDEYLDLEHLDQGVRQARKGTSPMGRLLPRKAVSEDTWNQVLAQLRAVPGTSTPARVQVAGLGGSK
jgi:hypothetical protein